MEANTTNDPRFMRCKPNRGYYVHFDLDLKEPED